jgi:integration host factor subunit beta
VKRVGAVAPAAAASVKPCRVGRNHMTKRGIVDELLIRHSGISFQDSESVVTLVFDAMTQGLAAGQHIELRGFGSFGVKLRQAREARNPKTGATVAVGAKRIPFFRAGRELRVKVNAAARSES